MDDSLCRKTKIKNKIKRNSSYKKSLKTRRLYSVIFRFYFVRTYFEVMFFQVITEVRTTITMLLVLVNRFICRLLFFLEFLRRFYVTFSHSLVNCLEFRTRIGVSIFIPISCLFLTCAYAFVYVGYCFSNPFSNVH